MSVNVIVTSATTYDMREVNTYQYDEAGGTTPLLDNATGVTGAAYVMHPDVASGNFLRMYAAVVLHSRSNPAVAASLNVYAAAGARATSDGCAVEGTVTLGI